MAEVFINGTARVTLVAAIGPTDTTITVTPPTAIVVPSSDTCRLLIDGELMECQGPNSGGVLTVVRGQESTTAASHNQGAVVTPMLTAAAMAQFKTDVSGSGGSGFAAPTVLTAGSTTTLTRAALQAVVVPTTGATTTFKAPASPSDGDLIRWSLSGATVASQAMFDPNGNNTVDMFTSPGTVTSSPVSLGLNPGANGVYRFESSGSLWRPW